MNAFSWPFLASFRLHIWPLLFSNFRRISLALACEIGKVKMAHMAMAEVRTGDRHIE